MNNLETIDDILIASDNYYNSCIEHLIKLGRVRKMPSGKYRVLSQKGKNLGTYKSKGKAKKRLKQVEFFKHLDKSHADDGKIIDLTEIDDFSYSAIMRKMRQNASKEQVKEYLQLFKKYFDQAIKNKVQKPERVALQHSIIQFNKKHRVKLDKKMVKNAAISELGNPILVGRYLADIVRFTLARISPERRPKAIISLRNKIYNLNENEISMKNLPPSSAIGQSITFVKHVLFNHDPRYVREVLNNVVRNL